MILALVFVAATAVQDLEIPENQGWVTDLAGLLEPGQEQALEALMESYKQGTTHEIALLTLPSLEGRPLERTALEIARAWGIGGVDANNGALLLVAVADRKMRIEVGRGLEGHLTDSISGRIIRDVIAPPFKAGRYYEGLSQGVAAIHAAIGGDYAPIDRASRKGGGSALFGLLPLLMIFVVFSALRRRTRGVRSGFGSALPWIMLGGMGSSRSGGGFGGGGFGGGGFSGFGGGGGFSGGGASGGW